MHKLKSAHTSPSYRWALLLMVLVTAALLRLWQLGDAPPGLYRDEAYNGLDALEVLAGNHSLFFAANNGREPLYIYLTSLSVLLFGQTVWALRLSAAIIGIVTTALTYRLAAGWFGWRTGLLAAWLWAVTLWPVHLSRIGLRVILLSLFLALVFWLGTEAYRHRHNHLWLLAGLVYGAAFYTYLAVRFTPLLFGAFAFYLVITGRGRRLWPGVAWFALGTAVALTPLALLAGQQPELILGRSEQVSILNPAVHQGDLPGTLWRQAGKALAMFFWQGDTILRHNPAGRPVFDPVTAVAFVAGLLLCLRAWRRPAAMLLLLWTAVMLGPTILAEDPPHFLRAAGILPALLLFPALGLSHLWTWTKLPCRLRSLLVIILALVTLLWTVRDYVVYARQPDTAYLFEAAARRMAEEINQTAPGVPIYIEDERFWKKWPSLRFLVNSETLLVPFRPEDGLGTLPEKPVAIYVWPYEPLDYLVQALPQQALIFVQPGAWHRGDLEETSYPLYVQFTVQETTTDWPVMANFDNQLQLRRVETMLPAEDMLQVDLYWSTESGVNRPLVAFVHVVTEEGPAGQSDMAPGQGYWLAQWWRPGLIVQDRHMIYLAQPYESHRQLLVGIYDATTQQRLPVYAPAGTPLGDTWHRQLGR
jgi:4-amino-4-deoxy-L-arabinose transferase-like glycosyltransferase